MPEFDQLRHPNDFALARGTGGAVLAGASTDACR
jgi:hypothetical protein